MVEQSALPGFSAQSEMIPEIRTLSLNNINLSNAAVMICLIERGNEIVFPLIKRTQHDLDKHAGQISLPGGKQDSGENLKDTAIREVFEEIGLQAEKIKPLVKLTTLPVPISSFLVYPFVSYYLENSEYKINPQEVQSVFEVSLTQLLDSDNRREEYQEDSRVPYYAFNGEKVWGATAMILAEFEAIIRQITKD